MRTRARVCVKKFDALWNEELKERERKKRGFLVAKLLVTFLSPCFFSPLSFEIRFVFFPRVNVHLPSLNAYFFVVNDDDQKIVCKNTTSNRSFFSLVQIIEENLIMGMSEQTGFTNPDLFIKQNFHSVIRK